MNVPIFQVDAFSNQVFSGNPAAVCPLADWLDDQILQKIAEENNLSETAFIVNHGDFYQLRWFTPQTEIDLCGHATLASAYVIMNHLESGKRLVRFGTKSGELTVIRSGDLYSMDFPKYIPQPCNPPEELLMAFNIEPLEVYSDRKYLLLFRNELEVRQVIPSMSLLKELDKFGVIITAPGDNSDFVSRFFAPAVGIPEDPVTGSAHCLLTPFWAERLKKNELHAFQVSRRGGELFLENKENRVAIAGRVALFMEGSIQF